MKAKSCLEKLQDLSKTSEHLATVNKATHSSNKRDFEKGESSKQGLRRKKTVSSDCEDNFIRKGISKYGYCRWTSILNDPNFKFHPSRKPCTLAVHAKKNMIMRQRTIPPTLQLCNKLQVLINFLNWYF